MPINSGNLKAFSTEREGGGKKSNVIDKSHGATILLIWKEKEYF